MTTPTDTPAKVLARIIDISQPETLLCCGQTANTVAGVWKQQAGRQLMTLDTTDPNAHMPPEKVADLALISETLEHLPFAEGVLLLGQLRNYGTGRIAALVPQMPDWRFTDFIGLGFQRHAELETETNPLTLYTYNLDTYNHKRAWNNPDNWANPHMWGKSWW
ncbi:DUF6231 family protein [Marinobacter sp.]|uniref:DUF6231 family protein n=1 Tax=Marinobacter sp. TaxID=50741 RepID=UPI0019F30C68|nr:DUF6231 family protein [Marinobacter sp.]MBE0485793.1 hypothetical protein [Marinobacter sp.]